MKYDRNRHLELLKHSQNLKSLGKYLCKENREDFLELCEYEGIIEEHLYWKKRREFALLMENFLNGTIDGEDFCTLSTAKKYIQ